MNNQHWNKCNQVETKESDNLEYHCLLRPYTLLLSLQTVVGEEWGRL